MNKQKEQAKEEIFQMDSLGSIEFDLTEAIKDLIYNIKSIKTDVERLKEYYKNIL